MTPLAPFKRLAVAVAATLATAAAAEVTIWKQPNFAGEALTVRGAMNNLGDRGFLDQASSIEVKSGVYEFCTQPDFRGECVVLERGRYARLEHNLNHRVESVREVVNYADRGRDRDDRWARGGKRGPAVEVFAAPDFQGPRVTVNRAEDSLADGPLGRRAASLVIHEGSWEVCTEPGFGGACSVLDPGSYEQLGRLHRRIGSLRRVG
jgi:hypothetical protein